MDDCIFCKIAAGEIPASIVHSDDSYVAFADIKPLADTHILVIPRTHHDDLDAFVAAGGDAAGMVAFVTATAARAGITGNYRVVSNIGTNAGQTVFHVHWHLLSGGALPGF